MGFRISLLTVRPGGSQTGPAEQFLQNYLRRCGPALAAELRTFRSAPALLQGAAEARKRDAAVLWLADTSGLSISSEQFAARIRQTRDGGHRHLLVAVGPANGWTDADRAQADLRLSLGPMTLPHELAALVLAEQIYRAGTILQGHPYHLGH